MALTHPRIDDTYQAMIDTFPLRRIQDDAHLDSAIAVIDSLIDRPQLTNGEQEYLDALGILVEAYENEHVQLPDVRGVDVLRYLIEVHSLKQSDLVPIFGTKSIVSEVLSSKRRLTVGHIQGLSAKFNVPAGVFIE